MWETSIDSWGDSVLYTLFFSMDSINWIELTADYNDTSFAWGISGLRDGTDYVVRVIAASEGFTTQQTTSQFEIDNEGDVTTTTTTATTTTVITTITETTTETTNTTITAPTDLDDNMLMYVGAGIGGVIFVIIIIVFMRRDSGSSQ